MVKIAGHTWVEGEIGLDQKFHRGNSENSGSHMGGGGIGPDKKLQLIYISLLWKILGHSFV